MAPSQGPSVSLNVHNVALNVHTIALNVHTIALNVHTIALNVNTIALDVHTAAPGGRDRGELQRERPLGYYLLQVQIPRVVLHGAGGAL